MRGSFFGALHRFRSRRVNSRMTSVGGRMAKLKRKSRVRKVHAAKKKAHAVKRLKPRQAKKPHAKKLLRAKSPAHAKKLHTPKPVAAKAGPAPKADEKAKKGKTPSAK